MLSRQREAGEQFLTSPPPGPLAHLPPQVGFRLEKVRWPVACCILLTGFLIQAQSVRSSEPSAEIDLHARVVRAVERGDRVEVHVELIARPGRDLPHALVRGPAASVAQARTAPGPRTATFRRGVEARFGYRVELPVGREHHLFFAVGDADDPGSPALGAAWLRVNLDPSKEPVDTGDLMQFRAVPAGRRGGG